jgi:regulator of protease activity HflC (stomatin/prohibitin superfamily)
MVSDAEAKARVFGAEVAAYRAAPELYLQRRYLEILEEGLDLVRKFLIVGDASNVIVEHDTHKEAGLDQVLAESVGGQK